MEKFNPFRPNHMVHPGMFSGRANEIEVIKKALIQTKHGNPCHFLIEGERGIGKSSLLLFLNYLAKGELGEKFNFLSVRIELSSATTNIDLLKKIGTDFKVEVSKKEKLKALAKDTWDFLTNWEVLGVKYEKKEKDLDRYQILDELVSSFANLFKATGSEIDGVVLLIDEADKGADDCNLGEFIKLFTEKLTFEGQEKVLICLAGLPTTMQKIKTSHESAPRVLQSISLKPLNENESESVIDSGLKEAQEKNKFKTEIAKDAKDLIVSLSEGYPHFLQQFCFCAFDLDKDNNITLDDVKSGAFDENGALGQLGKKFFIEQYNNRINSDDYRKVLDTMAKHSDGWISRADIIKESALPDGTVSNALKALKDRNIILVNETKQGVYKIPTKSFATWINAHSSITD